jgi:hypothetical protein
VVFDNHFPKIPFGASQNKILTGAAVHIISDEMAVSVKIAPTTLVHQPGKPITAYD